MFTNDNNCIPNIACRTSSELNDIVFTEAMVLQKLKKLKSKSSAGPDGLKSSFF